MIDYFITFAKENQHCTLLILAYLFAVSVFVVGAVLARYSYYIEYIGRREYDRMSREINLQYENKIKAERQKEAE